MIDDPPRILVSNDDGIGAPGLQALTDAAQALSPDVWIVAPERKWTAASHQLTFDREQTLTRVSDRVYACSGAPADCVVAAMTIVLPHGARPHLVLAGINDKRNVGEDVAYSGTTAIAREAAFWSVPAIAFSRDAADERPSDRDAFRELLCTLWRSRADWALDGHWLSINLPPSLPAPIAQPRIGRDKIGGACDVVERSETRIVYRLRRGRPGAGGTTPVAGDENEALAEGSITVVRCGWQGATPLPAAVLARWQPGGKMPD